MRVEREKIEKDKEGLMSKDLDEEKPRNSIPNDF